MKKGITPTSLHYDAVIKSYVSSNSSGRSINYILNNVFSDMEKHKIVGNTNTNTNTNTNINTNTNTNTNINTNTNTS
jgi:hypothetical protein